MLRDRSPVIMRPSPPTDLLKFATMIGMGSVMQRVPQIQQKEATSLPGAVVGAMSPYPVLVMVMMAQ